MSEHPRPDLGGVTGEFWTRLATDGLHLQRCADCRAWQHPPLPVCRACGRRALEWERASGTGEVWSYTVCHPPVLPAFAELVPYVVVVVRTAEGPFLVSRLLDLSATVAVGDRVELVATAVDDDLVLPLARVTATH